MDTLITPYNPAHMDNISPPGKLHGRTYTYADLHGGHHRKRDMPMQGFDPQYGNIVDYILRCTYDIWERKNVGIIATHYAEDGEIYTPLGYSGPVQGVIENTAQTLQAFPDRELYSVNIIWGGTENEGYLSSHLIRTIMTNTQDSTFGPASGKRIDIYTIADCLCKENLIIREWLVRDNGAYVRQLGLNIQQVAWNMAKADYENDITHWWERQTVQRTDTKSPITDVIGRPKTDDPTELVCNMLNDVWRAHYFGLVDEYYSYNVQIHGCGGREIIGTRHLKTLLTDIYGGLSNTDLVIEHTQTTASNAGENETFVHVRWSITGIHETAHMFGTGTKAPLYIMGISQFRVVNGRICEEWILFDELAIWKQIHLHTIQNNPSLLNNAE